MALPATDQFTGTNGTELPTYSANWTNILSTLTIHTNAVTGGAGDCAARWNADTFPADQYAKMTLTAIANSCHIGVAVRMKTDNSQNYYALVTDDTNIYLLKNVATVISAIGSFGSFGFFAVNDVLELRVVGNVLTPYKNGVVIAGIGPVTDSAHATGTAGVAGSGNLTTTRGDSWEAGSLKRWILGPH